jgi:hypothetical protein
MSARAAITLLVAAALPACRSHRPTPAPIPVADPAAPAARAQIYGEPLGEKGEAVTLATLLAGGEHYAGRAVTVEGLVRRACTRRGCWMELAPSADKAQAGCRVTFKNYGFFVPTDSAGAHARVQGVVDVSQVAAPVVRHLEEEGAVFPHKASDGTAAEVHILASGVELSR